MRTFFLKISSSKQSQDRALSADEHWWFPWKLSPFSLKGKGKPVAGRFHRQLRVDVTEEEGGREFKVGSHLHPSDSCVS